MKKKEKNKNLYNFNYESKDKKVKNKLINKLKFNKTIKEKEEKNKVSNNEIIIGVTKYPEEKNKNVKKKNNKKIKNTKKQDKKKGNKENIKKINPKTKIAIKFIKWIIIIGIIIGSIIYAMLSPLFNINSITVIGNNKISKEKLISLSEINIGENIFKINKKEIKKKTKENGYINTIKIKRKLPNNLEIIVEERTPTFIIKNGNGYVYINNQGYILEVSTEKIEVPILIGTSTENEKIKESNRLNEIDLKKLNTVLKIINVAKVNEIEELITSIDITDDNNYKLYLETEQKTAYIGDASNLETRMLYLTSILKSEQGIPGEIFVNMNINNEDAFFRESV